MATKPKLKYEMNGRFYVRIVKNCDGTILERAWFETQLLAHEWRAGRLARLQSVHFQVYGDITDRGI
jgi:hypothetical protein